MNCQIIELIEHQESKFTIDEIPDCISKLIWDKCEKKIDIEFPSLKTGNKLKLRPKGWVGFIPLNPDFTIRISPKITLYNLFRIIAYVYDTYNFNDLFQDDLIHCNVIEDFFELLAELLAKKVLERAQEGFYRTYFSTTGLQSCVRGRLDIQYVLQRFWETKLRCTYQELTGDIPDNQILAWTLLTVAQSGLCHKRFSTIQQAYRTLQRIVTVQPYSSNDCVDRNYNRLNEDYRSLHALCRFLLESTGASHQHGTHAMLAFLVNMPNLFQEFVPAWLDQKLSQDFHVEKQERYTLDLAQNLYFDIDLVLYETATQTARCVLDTKYKTTLETSDIQQIIAYASVKQCNEAILVFPTKPNKQVDKQINNIRVRTLIFPLDKPDIDDAGKCFLKELLHG
ncbi:MAG TPA: restriction endonuclease [Phormidium sp.]